MLIIRNVSPDVVGYYIDGRVERPAGRWLGHGCDALGLTGPVDGAELKRVLQGRHPDDGRYLPKRKPARRRAGWDLMFSAPKSVSLLDALVPPGEMTVSEAHRAAVSGVMSHLEEKMPLATPESLRRRPPGVAGTVAAVFEHRQNAAAEPHLHSHVLLANLVEVPGGEWMAGGWGRWNVERRGLFALYQMELRHGLAQAGWDLDWRIRPDGTAHLADVPRAAVRATSTQRWSTADVGRFEARRRAAPQPWLDRSIASGFGPADAPGRSGATAAARGATADLPDQAVTAAVTQRLLAERSAFRRADVTVALAACAPQGASIDAAEAWTDRFLAGSPMVPSPWSTPRWTTSLAAETDHRLAAGLRERAREPPIPGEIGAALHHWPQLTSAERRSVERLVGEGNRVEFLGSPAGSSGLMTHAAVIDASRTAWQEAGLSVAVMCRPSDGRRWEALTGLSRHESGRRPDVLVVDQADRRSTTELLSVLASNDARVRLILVEGGTMPRLTATASAGFSAAGDDLGRIHPGSPAPIELQPGVAGTDLTGRQAIGHLVDSWADSWTRPEPAHLVGLGVDEVSELNRRARTVLSHRGQITGPEVVVAGRRFGQGDRVIVLHGAADGLPNGAQGRIDHVGPESSEVGVRWNDGGATVLRGREAGALGYAYALLPATAIRVAGSVLLLGSEEAAPRLRPRILESARAAPEVGSGHHRPRLVETGFLLR